MNGTVNEKTHYVFQGTEPIFEKRIKNGQADKIRSYVYAGSKLIARIDGVIGDTSAKKYWYHTDHLGSVKAVTNHLGLQVWKADYFAFGQQYGKEKLDPTFEEDDLGFTGKGYDAEIGLYYFNARWYDAETGRFISEDPVADPNNPNLYTYCRNNPIGYTDPTGLYSGENPGVEGWKEGELTNQNTEVAGVNGYPGQSPNIEGWGSNNNQVYCGNNGNNDYYDSRDFEKYFPPNNNGGRYYQTSDGMWHSMEEWHNELRETLEGEGFIYTSTGDIIDTRYALDVYLDEFRRYTENLIAQLNEYHQLNSAGFPLPTWLIQEWKNFQTAVGEYNGAIRNTIAENGRIIDWFVKDAFNNIIKAIEVKYVQFIRNTKKLQTFVDLYRGKFELWISPYTKSISVELLYKIRDTGGKVILFIEGTAPKVLNIDALINSEGQILRTPVFYLPDWMWMFPDINPGYQFRA